MTMSLLRHRIWWPIHKVAAVTLVLVWLHGGGFTTGTGASALFAGRRLASAGVVVVTINYRLGALGLLAHPDLVEDTANGWGNCPVFH